MMVDPIGLIQGTGSKASVTIVNLPHLSLSHTHTHTLTHSHTLLFLHCHNPAHEEQCKWSGAVDLTAVCLDHRASSEYQSDFQLQCIPSTYSTSYDIVKTSCTAHSFNMKPNWVVGEKVDIKIYEDQVIIQRGQLYLPFNCV